MPGWSSKPDQPEAGFYQRRMVRGGTWVPCKLWQEGDTWKALLNGEPYDGEICDLWVWVMGHPISEAEYNYLLARSSHAKRWLPEHPFADPRKPVDWLKTPVMKGPRAKGPRK